jgi:hypothetical protein
MNGARRTLVAALLAAALLLAGLVLPGAAQADEPNCGPPTGCGRITMASHSSFGSWMWYTDNWNTSTNQGSGERRSLYPGQTTTFYDTDGFYVPLGFEARVIAGGNPYTYHPGWWRCRGCHITLLFRSV